jgi:hypothetical protein
MAQPRDATVTRHARMKTSHLSLCCLKIQPHHLSPCPVADRIIIKDLGNLGKLFVSISVVITLSSLFGTSILKHAADFKEDGCRRLLRLVLFVLCILSSFSARINTRNMAILPSHDARQWQVTEATSQ